jgi:hypothetical protein
MIGALLTIDRSYGSGASVSSGADVSFASRSPLRLGVPKFAVHLGMSLRRTLTGCIAVLSAATVFILVTY